MVEYNTKYYKNTMGDEAQGTLIQDDKKSKIHSDLICHC